MQKGSWGGGRGGAGESIEDLFDNMNGQRKRERERERGRGERTKNLRLLLCRPVFAILFRITESQFRLFRQWRG